MAKTDKYSLSSESRSIFAGVLFFGFGFREADPGRSPSNLLFVLFDLTKLFLLFSVVDVFGVIIELINGLDLEFWSPMKLARLTKPILQLFSSGSSPGPGARTSFVTKNKKNNDYINRFITLSNFHCNCKLPAATLSILKSISNPSTWNIPGFPTPSSIVFRHFWTPNRKSSMSGAKVFRKQIMRII